jgi:hypothetical protein
VTGSTHRSREQPMPLLLQLTLLGFAGFGWIAYSVADSRAERGITLAFIAAILGLLVIDVLRCRRVVFEPDALVVGGRRYAWADLEVPHFREVPLARAGMFVALTDEARERLRLPPPRHRDHGFGLAPAPTPEAAAKRYDLFLRARRDRLEAWYAWVSVRLLGHMTKQLEDIHNVLHPTTPVIDGVTAAAIIDDANGITLELHARSHEALRQHARAVISAALPDDAKWNPGFARGVMVFVGPLALANAPEADAALAHVKAAVKASVAGTPRVIEALWVARTQARE